MTAPWTLFESRQCYPMANAVTLGEHMFGEGLLGAVPFRLTRDPILTYNVVMVLSLWVPAAAMCAWVYYWTTSAAAALVAGLLFGLTPMRVADPVHLSVVGGRWIPLALLFTHRLFTGRRWGDAVLMTLFIGLQFLGSIYPLTAFAIIAAVYGVCLLVRSARQLPALAPKLLAVGAVVGGIAATVLGPYLETRAAWQDLLRGRPTLLYSLGDFGFGGLAYPGSVLLVLAAIGVADRFRAPRCTRGYDPRWALVVAGLCVLWTAVWSVPLPAGFALPSPFVLASHFIPGLDAVRAGGAVRSGIFVVAAFLAGYGVLALTERCRVGVRWLITAVIAAAALADVFYPPAATSSFGGSFAMQARSIRPSDALIDLYGRLPSGAVLDLPFGLNPRGATVDMGHDLLLAAFHQHPVAACYNSFPSPMQKEIAWLAGRLPDEKAAEALYALGFRAAVVHEEVLSGYPGLAYDRAALTRAATGHARLVELGAADGHTAYGLESPIPVQAGFAALAAAAAPPDVSEAAPPASTIAFTFQNQRDASYRHPAPIAPTRLLVRWQALSGLVRGEYQSAGMLPLALARDEVVVRSLAVPVPGVAGEYEVTLSPTVMPSLVIARRRVRVRLP